MTREDLADLISGIATDYDLEDMEFVWALVDELAHHFVLEDTEEDLDSDD